jgi:hypothetical protein
MNLDVIRTLVVDENLVLCRVLLACHRAVVRRESESVSTAADPKPKTNLLGQMTSRKSTRTTPPQIQNLKPKRFVGGRT